MAELYQISTRGLMDGFSKEQAVDLLSALFRRSKNEIQTMLGKEGYIVKKGMDLQAAVKYKVTLEQRGCKCSIEACSKNGQTHSQFPDTVQIVEEIDQATIPFKIDKKAFELALQEIIVNTLDPEATPAAGSAPADRSVDADKDAAKETTSRLVPVVTNEIGTTTSDQPFFVQTPQHICCNCGRDAHLDTYHTKFFRPIVYSTRFEKKRVIALDLPYCPLCAGSIDQYPMNNAFKGLIAFGIWFILFFVITVEMNLAQHGLFLKLVMMVLSAVPSYLLLRWMAKPSAPQTSKYTPVIIKEFSGNPKWLRNEGMSKMLATKIAQFVGLVAKKISKSDPGRIAKITMAFSNPTYASAFKKLNKKFIQQGFIRVR